MSCRSLYNGHFIVHYKHIHSHILAHTYQLLPRLKHRSTHVTYPEKECELTHPNTAINTSKQKHVNIHTLHIQKHTSIHTHTEHSQISVCVQTCNMHSHTHTHTMYHFCGLTPGLHFLMTNLTQYFTNTLPCARLRVTLALFVVVYFSFTPFSLSWLCLCSKRFKQSMFSGWNTDD